MSANKIIDVAVARLPEGTLQVFAVDPSHGLRTCWKVSLDPGADWTPWDSFPGLVQRITSGSLPIGVPQLWSIGLDGKLYTCWKVSDQPGADWTGWDLMPGAPAAVVDVAAVQLPQSGLQLFAIDASHVLSTCWKTSNQPGAEWTSWGRFGATGSLQRITSGNLPGGVPQLWSIGLDGKLYTCWKVSDQPGADWTGWSEFDAGTRGSTSETNAKRAQVVLRHLYCAKTTEAGHDEVYYIMGGTDGEGKQISHRGPDATQGGDADNQTAWDMNDSGDQQNRDLNAVLYDGVLAAEQAATLLFSFLESDGTNFGTTLQAAAGLAQKVDSELKDPDPWVKIAAGVAEFVAGIVPTNQDDFLGAFALRVKNDNGNVVVTEAMPGSYTSVVHPLSGERFTYRFQHDDGDYNAHFEVRGVA